MRTHQKMADLATRQYGVVTRAQLAALGYSDEMIDHASETGRLQAWHRSVFAVGHQSLSAHGLCMAAVLFRGEGALVSYQSAVWLWGLERKLEIPVHVSVRWRGHAQDAIGLHHCPALRDEDVAETEGLPVTGVTRTLLDYASTATHYRLERAIDQADRLGLLDLAAIGRITEEVSGHRGRGPLLRAMVIYRESGFTRSGGEKRMLAALADAGVRRPVVNNFVEGHELDFFWEQERLVVELDSWEHHRGRRSFEEDRKRQEELSMAGIETIRITGTRLRREPRKVARRISQHLDRRRADLAA
ncbi:MAG TPA: type IV toxin-antitoxin system AbiEi family antitoxin domain-containing protein [Solirubrobacterales bacterium]